MNKALSGLIAVTCVAVLIAVGWYLYSERQRVVAEDRAAAIQARVAEMEVERLKAEAQQLRRVKGEKNLTPNVCNRFAQLTYPDAPGQPVKTTEYAEDLKLCAEFDRLGDYERRQLVSAGIIK